VIACDGIWDCVTSQQSVDKFHAAIKSRKAGEKPSKVVEDLFD